MMAHALRFSSLHFLESPKGGGTMGYLKEAASGSSGCRRLGSGRLLGLGHGSWSWAPRGSCKGFRPRILRDCPCCSRCSRCSRRPLGRRKPDPAVPNGQSLKLNRFSCFRLCLRSKERQVMSQQFNTMSNDSIVLPSLSRSAQLIGRERWLAPQHCPHAGLHVNMKQTPTTRASKSRSASGILAGRCRTSHLGRS